MTALKKIDQGHYAATVNGRRYEVSRNLNESLHSPIAWVLARDGEWIDEGATFGEMKAHFLRIADKAERDRLAMTTKTEPGPTSSPRAYFKTLSDLELAAYLVDLERKIQTYEATGRQRDLTRDEHRAISTQIAEKEAALREVKRRRNVA